MFKRYLVGLLVLPLLVQCGAAQPPTIVIEATPTIKELCIKLQTVDNSLFGEDRRMYDIIINCNTNEIIYIGEVNEND